MELEKLSLENRDNFIEDNRKFIKHSAEQICRRRLDWNNDDELSIAVIAFNKACNSYQQINIDFFAFARVLIRNSLIDYFRKCKNVPYLIFDEEEDSELDYIDLKNSIKSFSADEEKKERIDEMIQFSQELSKYKLDYSILVSSSPSHRDTRNIALNVALACTRCQDILDYVTDKKILPIKQIILLTGQNRKFIDKWRRYILALIIILSSKEFPHIKSYLNIKVGEKND